MPIDSRNIIKPFIEEKGGLMPALHALQDHLGFISKDNIEELITTPSAERILYLGQAFREGLPLDKIQYLTKIDPWFLSYIEEIISLEQTVKELSLETLDKDLLFQLKRKGFSDIRLAA